MNFVNFINTGLDDRILKSMNVESPSEELVKAMNKQGLVQKEVQVRGKNGQTFIRKQWIKAGEDQSTQQQTKAQPEETKDKKPAKKEESKQHWTKVGTSQEAKAQIAQMLSSGKSRSDCMSEFKSAGVTWKESSNEGINWMRAAMAMNKHLTSGNTTSDSTQLSDNQDDNNQSSKSLASKSSINNLRQAIKNGISKEDFRIKLLNLERHENEFSNETIDLSKSELYRVFGSSNINDIVSKYKKSELGSLVDKLESGETSKDLEKPYEPSKKDTEMTENNIQSLVDSAKKGDIVHMMNITDYGNGIVGYETVSGTIVSKYHDGKSLRIKWDKHQVSPHGEVNYIGSHNVGSKSVKYWIER